MKKHYYYIYTKNQVNKCLFCLKTDELYAVFDKDQQNTGKIINNNNNIVTLNIRAIRITDRNRRIKHFKNDLKQTIRRFNFIIWYLRFRNFGFRKIRYKSSKFPLMHPYLSFCGWLDV